MHIKSMVIEGFKSYGTRTEINGFDPLFNAITGLNGSGKSNILDSICFVLGITNLSQVRASSLQELVYKNGQAGITKAAVTVKFDNTDPANCPVGYESHKEITVTRTIAVGGKNKYLINGVVATNSRVQDFFQSVHLNVNNPHFLIMQGRITKVLNMKPHEILSMVEEAAGTRMYETKKETSLKVMDKKESRLQEIDNILREDITPTLHKLKEERKDYVEYTKVVRELDHLNKLYIAWQFVQAQNSCSKSNEDGIKIQEELDKNAEQIRVAEGNMREIDEKIAALEHKKDEEAGGLLQKLEANLKEKQMAETKMSSKLQFIKDALKSDQKKKAEILKNLKDDQASVANKEKELAKLMKAINQLQETCKRDADAVTAAQKHFQAVSAGLSSNTEGEAATLAEQMMSAKSEITAAETEEKQAEMKLKYVKEDIVKKKEACKRTADNYKKDQSAFKVVEQEAHRLKKELERLNYEEGKTEKLQSEKRNLFQEIDSLKEKLEMMYLRFPQLNFEFQDPTPNFDRRKVHGLVCKLIKIKDSSTATALEITAGGKLYNVVVDNEITGKLLLNRGQLKTRYTIIPLNKIDRRMIEDGVARRAMSLVGESNVRVALSLVNFDPEVLPAMQYIFGNTFVCPSMEPAKTVAFADGIKRRSVTLEGEVFDPSGTLSGGSLGQRGNILLALSQVNEVEQNLRAKEVNYNRINKELSQISQVAEKYRVLQQKCDMKAREVELLKSRLEQSDHHQQLEEINALQQSIEDQQAVLLKCQEVKKKAAKRVKELDLKINNSKSVREQELKNAEKAVNEAKKRADVSAKKFKETEQEIESLRLETDEIKNGLNNYEEQLENIENVIKAHEGQIEEASSQLAEIKKSVSEAIQEVKAQKAVLKAHSLEIAKLHKEKEALNKEVENLKLQIQQLEHDLEKSKNDNKEASRKVEKYLASYEWIEEEKKYFGVPNTEYDFNAHNPQDAAHRINKLQETKNKLSKTVNMRAQNMLQNAEEQYKDLMQKKRIVLNDKMQIEAVIRELDEKKRLALIAACEQVNKDFGSIFSTLLPGAKAKLVPPEGKTVLDGVEFRVGFGDVWKESLTELSGGQRSLVALSLILSLLLFKPAPIYILDEVDAALDLSHTQNIGQMLKMHFKKSQFIIVSLKDGMFNNANVLFKTKFVDGMSTVTRTTQNTSKR